MPEVNKTVAAGLAAYYQYIAQDLHKWADPLSNEQFWRQPYPYGNSVGHLLLHLTGNLNYYIGARSPFPRCVLRCNSSNCPSNARASVQRCFRKDRVGARIAHSKAGPPTCANLGRYIGSRPPGRLPRFCLLQAWNRINSLLREKVKD